MNALDVKKETLKSKVMAKFSHYTAGNLYYTVQLASGLYQFPISVVDQIHNCEGCGCLFTNHLPYAHYRLSADLGTTSFDVEVKASLLNRWIDKAIQANEFVYLRDKE